MSAPKITVLTPTIRPEGLALVEKTLKRQTFDNFEWVISSPMEIESKHSWARYLIDPPKREGDYWAIYKAYNQMVKEAQGELIVSIQDYTYAEPHALEKFWAHYELDNTKVVSGVGNKYSDDTWTVETWRDPRMRDDHGSFYGCYHNDIEWNLAAIPKKAIYDVGGFDEELDKYSSLCGLDVLERMNIIGGWDFCLDQTNKSYSLEHGRLNGWDENTPFNGVWQQRKEEYLVNPVLGYLQ